MREEGGGEGGEREEGGGEGGEREEGGGEGGEREEGGGEGGEREEGGGEGGEREEGGGEGGREEFVFRVVVTVSLPTLRASDDIDTTQVSVVVYGAVTATNNYYSG